MKNESKKAEATTDKNQSSATPDSKPDAEESGLSEPTTPGTPGSGETAGSQGQPDKMIGETDEINQLRQRLEVLEKKNAELQDQYLRKAADFDNYRKRMIREKQEAVDFANTNLLVDLVQILDDFDRAIDAGQQESGSTVAAFADGIKIIRGQLSSMLETKYELTYYVAKGQGFDPTIHEAIGTVVSSEITEPTVAQEFVKGYRLKDRVIRLAKVMVSMPAGEETEQPKA